MEHIWSHRSHSTGDLQCLQTCINCVFEFTMFVVCEYKLFTKKHIVKCLKRLDTLWFFSIKQRKCLKWLDTSLWICVANFAEPSAVRSSCQGSRLYKLTNSAQKQDACYMIKKRSNNTRSLPLMKFWWKDILSYFNVEFPWRKGIRLVKRHASCWFQPLWKIFVKMEHFPPNRKWT